MEANRIPVIIGAAQVADRSEQYPDSLDLAERAVRLAADDAGPFVLDRIDWLGIVRQLSFPELDDMPKLLPSRLGIAPRHVEQTGIPSGDSPMLLLNEAANAIGRGEARLACIAGAEALRSAMRRPDFNIFAGTIGDSPLRRRYGLETAAAIYPFYENASRAAWKMTMAEAQAESGRIWSLMSEIAQEEDAAWIRRAHSVEEITHADERNRLIAFPYPKLMVANASVNQGAAFIVASLATARELGVAEKDIVYVGLGAAAAECDDPLLRASYADSPSMAVTLRAVMRLNRLETADLDLVEFYSCFPCVPKIARRVLDWPLEKPMTCFGGLTFGGGPIGNYMSHAAASLYRRLKSRPNANGLLFANGGYATHNHAIVLTTRPQPAGLFPQNFHFQSEADAIRDAAPSLDDAREGAARLETYTLLYRRDGTPDFGVVLGRRADGSRVIARVDGSDAPMIAKLTGHHGEPIGTAGSAIKAVDGLMRWSAA